MTVGPIPWTAMVEYARVHDFDQEQFGDLVFYMKMMDDAYLRHVRAKSEKKK